MLKKILSSTAVAMLAVSVSGASMAAEKNTNLAAAHAAKAEEKKEANIGDFSANVAIYSDYIYRGVSQTQREPAIQGGFDWSHDIGLYVGTWASNVNFGDGDQAHVEVDVYGGYSRSFGNFGFDINFLYYLYPGASSSLNYDFWEITPSISYDFGFMSVGAGVSFSDDFFGGSGDAQFYKATVDVPLPRGFSVSGHVAYQAVDDNATFALPDYWTWGVGVSYDLGELHSKLANISIGAEYIDTDISTGACGSQNCEARGVFNISASF